MHHAGINDDEASNRSAALRRVRLRGLPCKVPRCWPQHEGVAASPCARWPIDSRRCSRPTAGEFPGPPMQRQIRAVAIRRLLFSLVLACFALTAAAADSGRRARPRALSRQGGPGRLLGVLVRAVPPVLSLAQRHAGQVRATRTGRHRRQRRSRARGCRAVPADVRPSFRSSTTPPARCSPLRLARHASSYVIGPKGDIVGRHIGFRNGLARGARGAQLQKLLETTE